MARLDNSNIKILVIDTLPVMAEGIAAFLLTEEQRFVVNTALNYRDSIEYVEKWKPDMVILGPNLSNAIKNQLITEIKRNQPMVKIIIFSENMGDCKINFELNEINGLLPKTCNQNEMIDEIIKVYNDENVHPPHIDYHSIVNSDRNYDNIQEHHALALLTQREMEVLSLMSQGLHNKEIALKLRIKVRTVEFHISNVLGKLGVDSRIEAVIIYLKNQTEEQNVNI